MATPTRRAYCPRTARRPAARGDDFAHQIIVAIDRSEEAAAALALTGRLASALGLTSTLCTSDGGW